ncbi:MAG: DUF547 domain-containing protein [Saprospiraceae bacterium]
MKFNLVIIITLVSCRYDKPSAQTTGVSHDLFDHLLKKYVNNLGNVDYEGFKKDKVMLDTYLSNLSKNPPLMNWTKEEQLAYWINAYNAFTISLVATHYPVNSIKDIKPGIPFINSVWDIKFIKIGNKTYDLNNIEHSILRKKFNEPRIHFAINCASYSCPRLRNEAYTSAKLESQLTEAAKSFLSDKTKNDITANTIHISKIFDWFTGDFKKNGNLIDFLNRYAPMRINPTAKIEYKEYVWTLNRQ